MYTRAVRKELIDSYSCLKSSLAGFLRFQYPHDYSKPKVRSQFPGPQHQEALQNIQSYNIDQFYQIKRFIDMKKSKGNFFRDIDGNVVLDLHCNYGSLPLGYNHDELINARDSELYDRFIGQSTNLSNMPPDDYADLLREVVMPIAPEGMKQVYLTDGTMTQANESALMLAMAKYQRNHGSQNVGDLCVLGFENSYHGNSIGTLSCSDESSNTQKVPTFKWPKAPFPKLKFPLAEHEIENTKEENRCLQEFKQIIQSRKSEGKDVAAIIIEPISSIENTIATPKFYKSIRKIASEHGIPFIVDETKTGLGSTGKMWGHDNWYLSTPPDIVTFGGSAGISGYYTTLDYRQSDSQTHFEQSVDMIKLLNYGVIWKYIQRKDLLNYVNDTSTFLKVELRRIENEKGLVQNVRGNGTFLGFDVSSERTAESLQGYFFKTGVHLLRCGPKTFGMRPALILEPKHAAQLREVLMYYHPNYKNSL